MRETAIVELRPIVIFGHCHDDGLVQLKASLVKSGNVNFMAGRLDEGGARDSETLARAALVIVSSATTSLEERERIGRAAVRYSVPLLLLT